MIKLKSLIIKEYLALSDDGEIRVIDGDPNDQNYMVSTDEFPTKLVKGRIFPAYSIKTRQHSAFGNDRFPKEKQNQMRVALKHPVDIKSENVVAKMIKNSLPAMSRLIHPERIDTIIPIPSQSNLNDQICNMLHKFCKNSVYLDGALGKSTWRDVKLNKTVLKNEKEKSKIQAQEFLDQQQKNHPDDEFQSKHVGVANGMGFRRYYMDFLKFNLENRKKEEYSQLIKGKHILLVDDTLEEGVTIDEAIRQIQKYKPASIRVYILLYTKRIPKDKDTEEKTGR